MKAAREKSIASPPKRSRKASLADRHASLARSANSAPSVPPASVSAAHQWTFLTNHAHVLLLLPRSPSPVLREVALQVGITERAVQRIIADLEASGIIVREKVGRQNHYRIRADQPFRHPIASHRKVGDLLALINGADE